MSAYITPLGGTDGGTFAPADFGDDDANAPIAATFDIGGNGQAAPYTLAVNSMLSKQMEEIRGKAAAAMSTTRNWKFRLRDFMAQKNNDLLDFLKLTVPHHPVLGPGEVLLRKFGNPNVTPTHPSVRDMVMDASGGSYLDEINEALKSMSGQDPLHDYAAHTHIIYDLYKEAGDATLRAQHILKGKLEKLDRIQGKISGLFEVDTNDKFEPLMEASEAYLKKIFDDIQIEHDYKGVIEAYRKFVTLRDIVTQSRALLASESEPLCSICLNESVMYALSPCGHTFCQTCVRRQAGQCFVCRTNIKDKLKLFFG